MIHRRSISWQEYLSFSGGFLPAARKPLRNASAEREPVQWARVWGWSCSAPKRKEEELRAMRKGVGQCKILRSSLLGPWRPQFRTCIAMRIWAQIVRSEGAKNEDDEGLQSILSRPERTENDGQAPDGGDGDEPPPLSTSSRGRC